MLNRMRLYMVLVACGGTLLPIAAQAQDALSSQAYSQINQVQQQLNSGLISPAQANDLINRYSDVIKKDQQWSMQDGGRLNVPDRLDLQGKLKGDNKRLFNALKNNGVNGINGVNTLGMVAPTTMLAPTSMVQSGCRRLYGAFTGSPYGTAVNTMPYGSVGTGYAPANAYGLAPTNPYGLASTSYNAAYGVAPIGYTPNLYNSPIGVSPVGYASNGLYNSQYNPYLNNGSGNGWQGLLNRWH